jgi:hypothetical protein
VKSGLLLDVVECGSPTLALLGREDQVLLELGLLMSPSSVLIVTVTA